jgi:tetratricopeptide (TPR) repeat protein
MHDRGEEPTFFKNVLNINAGDKSIERKSISSLMGEAKKYNNKGGDHKMKGELDQAILDFTTALNLAERAIIKENCNHKYRSLILVNRGKAYVAKGDFDKAILDFTQALEYDGIIKILNSKNIEQITKIALFNAIKILPNEDKTAYLNMSKDKGTPLNIRFNKIENIVENVFANNFQKAIQQELDKCSVNQKRLGIN